MSAVAEGLNNPASGRDVSRDPLTTWDAEAVRADFPALQQTVHGKPLIYLDNAATTQKPRVVLESLMLAYTEMCANIHRGVHLLSERATLAYESVREDVRRFLNAASTREIIFVRGTTEAINLVAQTYGRTHVQKGDDIVITALEHHSNIVPWQMLCEAQGASLKVAPINTAGEVDIDALEQLIGPRTRLVAVSHISNALGTVNPIRRIVEMAHARGVPVLVDGAQAVPHMPVDVQALGCDFYCFSAHKLFGPTGVGVLYGRAELLEAMPPYQGGGDMISSVTFAKTTYNALPYKFEAGTPDIAGVIGFGAALRYLRGLDMQAAAAYEDALLAYATDAIQSLPGARLIGTARKRASVVSFLLGNIHPHDMGTILDRQGIAIRTGHHCAQPVMAFFGVAATARASIAFYNTPRDIDVLVQGLREVQRIFVG